MNVVTNPEHTRQRFFIDERCKYCGQKKFSEVEVEFFEGNLLTIFQAELLYSIYALNKKPYDYANYHKCPAGQEFIKNIKSIKVNG